MNQFRPQDNPYSPVYLWKADHWQTLNHFHPWDEWSDDDGTCVPEVAERFKMDIDMQPFDGVMVAGE